mmetsp:Transcript_9236/g.20060  ORF Transcript_9236/g.20060 Transcript_9236/m.20060 type:complete len:205 (-) Transcript_9236:1019-1633(-)
MHSSVPSLAISATDVLATISSPSILLLSQQPACGFPFDPVVSVRDQFPMRVLVFLFVNATENASSCSIRFWVCQFFFVFCFLFFFLVPEKKTREICRHLRMRQVNGYALNEFSTPKPPQDTLARPWQDYLVLFSFLLFSFSSFLLFFFSSFLICCFLVFLLSCCLAETCRSLTSTQDALARPWHDYLLVFLFSCFLFSCFLAET